MFVGGGANSDAYNKQTKAGRGTLILNWYEESVLRETTGEGRTESRAHLPKKHDDLYLKPTQEIQEIYEKANAGDQTFDRVFGRRRQPSFETENSQKYTGTAPLKPQTGKKSQLLEEQFLKQVNAEIEKKTQEEERLINERNFNTTYSNEFLNKPLYQNAVGRRVMRDQNGNAVPPENRDVDLLAENGFTKPTPVLPDSELKKLIKVENYVTDRPITFYTEKMQDGTYYASKANNDQNAFNRNNEFVSTFSNYKNRVK